MKSVEDLDLEVLKEFAKLYDNYEVLDFENPSVMQTQEKKFSNNVKAIRNAVPSSLRVVVEAPVRSWKICLSICVSTSFANLEAVLFSINDLTTVG